MNYKIEDNKIKFFDCPDQKDFLRALGCKVNRKEKIYEIFYSIDSTEIINNWYPDLKIPVPTFEKDKVTGVTFKQKGLYDHQKESIIAGLSNPYFADMSDCGTGKTKVHMELIIQRNVFPVLIVCPVSIMEPVWKKELEENGFYPIILNKGSVKNTEILKADPYKWSHSGAKHIFVINYDSIYNIRLELAKIDWKYVILDESTKIKSPKSKRSKAIIKLFKDVIYKGIMTGTIAPNGLLDIFNQYNFLNPQLFGNSWYYFREQMMQQVTDWIWLPKPCSFMKFKTRVNECSIQHKKRDCLDLPPLVHIAREIIMPPVQKRLYDQMKNELLIELEDEVITAPFATTKMMKLRQIASGFIYNEDEKIDLPGSGKISELKDILELHNEEQALIFCSFNYTKEIVLKALGSDAKVFGGNAATKTEVLEDFEIGRIKYMIANPASAGHGLNLQFCSLTIYIEHDFNLEYYEQSLQRIERIGQKNKMTVYHFNTKGTLEPYIFKALSSKQQLNKNLDINHLKKIL